METMTTKRSKPVVIKKILELGLVDDRKQLRKKRSSKGGKKKVTEDGWAEGGVDDGKLSIPLFYSQGYSTEHFWGKIFAK